MRTGLTLPPATKLRSVFSQMRSDFAASAVVIKRLSAMMKLFLCGSHKNKKRLFAMPMWHGGLLETPTAALARSGPRRGSYDTRKHGPMGQRAYGL